VTDHLPGSAIANTATHLVGYVGAEPAATLRLRYFGDFVKIERLAVLIYLIGLLLDRIAELAVARQNGEPDLPCRAHAIYL